MKLFITDIKNITFNRLNEIDPKRAQKAMRYKQIDDKKRCIAAGLLIKKYLKDSNISENQFGKPVADNGICFNLSHSGDYVVLAYDDSEIGCDIEKINYINAEKTGKLVFCENEMQIINSSQDKIGVFYDLWTKKESFLKCIGEGFHHKAKSVDISCGCLQENGKYYYMKTWRFSDYVISVCSQNNCFPDTLEFTEV